MLEGKPYPVQEAIRKWLYDEDLESTIELPDGYSRVGEEDEPEDDYEPPTGMHLENGVIVIDDYDALPPSRISPHTVHNRALQDLAEANIERIVYEDGTQAPAYQIAEEG